MDNSLASPRDMKFLTDLTNIIREHISERKFGVANLADCTGKSRITLHRFLRRTVNQPAGGFIRSVKLDNAAGLIGRGELKIREAADLSGFGNLSYFSKCFRERFGSLPSEYRILREKSLERRA